MLAKDPLHTVCNSAPNAAASIVRKPLVRVTHPFHPLKGQELSCVGERHNLYATCLLLRTDEGTVVVGGPSIRSIPAPRVFAATNAFSAPYPSGKLLRKIKTENRGLIYDPYLWEYGFMSKTTLDISETLMVRVKKRAAELRLSMKSVVEAALTSYLKGSHRSKKKALNQIKWKTVDGGLPHGLNVSDREEMFHWLRDKK